MLATTPRQIPTLAVQNVRIHRDQIEVECLDDGEGGANVHAVPHLDSDGCFKSATVLRVEFVDGDGRPTDALCRCDMTADQCAEWDVEAFALVDGSERYRERVEERFAERED